MRAALTAVLAGCLLIRVVRAGCAWNSVARFYFAASQSWSLIGAVFFLAPFAVILLTGLALWSDWRRAMPLGLVSFFANGFFVLEEGLICFARLINGNSGYVGAEPGLSLLVCAVSVAVILRNSRLR